MKRRGIIVLGSLVVLGVLTWIVQQAQGPPDPVYQGRPLSYWLRGYILDGYFQGATPKDIPEFRIAPNRPQASEAMHHIGTNAIPMLLQWLRAKDSPFNLKLVRLAQRQRFIPVDYIPARDRNNAAGWWFNYLAEHRKKESTNVIPALIRIYQENISEDSRRNTAYSLCGFGPAAEQAVPVLLQDLAHTNAIHRLQILHVLVQIRARPDLCVPAISKLLNDPVYQVRDDAAFALVSLGAEMRLPPHSQPFVLRTNAPASSTNAVIR